MLITPGAYCTTRRSTLGFVLQNFSICPWTPADPSRLTEHEGHVPKIDSEPSDFQEWPSSRVNCVYIRLSWWIRFINQTLSGTNISVWYPYACWVLVLDNHIMYIFEDGLFYLCPCVRDKQNPISRSLGVDWYMQHSEERKKIHILRYLVFILFYYFCSAFACKRCINKDQFLNGNGGTVYIL